MKEDNTNTINMVENHIRTLNVIDDDVLNILKKIPRKLFVPKKYKAFANVDTSSSDKSKGPILYRRTEEAERYYKTLY